MRRRDLVAGIGSLGVLAGAGSIVRYGPPSVGGDGEADGETEDDGEEDEEWPIEVETIEARGSEAGTLTVPSEDVMVLMFFVNGCGNCQVQAGRLADARGELEADHGDDVRFLSLTYDSEEQIPPDELREWWETHGGNGFLSYEASRPMQEYAAVGYPVTIVIDPDGEEHWRETGTTSGREVAAEVESVLEATADENGEAETEDLSDDETENGADDGAEGDTDASENESDSETD
ncbi:alkyl hydroperoxide reductase [Natronococcus sp. A-GB7]|uniref:TlpA family protein disulfide reductase n=1 Tax=Natronococcus sp. A-GB7 TaxID=3037649 RepID=UPI00241E1CCE|nr:alkyl hydroperoxide reductase [Natronococcus sp. A-GB7]MDG5817489.1 alkyl hydroperoxide reductase [Natronococcus sp. A-GB7]